MPLQAGHISSTMSDFIGFICVRLRRRTTRAISYSFPKFRNQLRSVTLNNKVKLNLALLVLLHSRICATWRVTTTTYWMPMATASSSD